MTTDRATERDMRTAKAALNYGPDEQVSPMDAEYVENIASLLAAERARVLAPVLALADELGRDAGTYADEAAEDLRRCNDDAATQHQVASNAYRDAVARLRATVAGALGEA